MSYTINPQTAQDSIAAFLASSYPHVPIIPDGIVDADDSTIKYFPDASVKPFIVLWFSTVKRRPRGRSFADYKLDSHFATVDVIVISNDPTVSRTLMNDVSDKLVGYRAQDGGRLHKSASLWGQARSVDILNKPTRWAMTDRFDFAVSSRKVAP